MHQLYYQIDSASHFVFSIFARVKKVISEIIEGEMWKSNEENIVSNEFHKWINLSIQNHQTVKVWS